MITGYIGSIRKSSAAALECLAGIFLRANLGIEARLLFAGFIAITFTAVVLQWSFSYGRLAYDITYDDVGYFQDAYSRIKTLYEQGWGFLLADLFRNPPHSPYASLLAFTGFALFGPVDWAPYLMNGVTVFLILGFLTYILRNIPFLISALLVILFLFVPLSFYAVHEFRPDYAVALLTCMFACLAFESSLSEQNRRSFKLRWAGVVFGLALLSKPSFFAHTLALGIGVSALIVLHQPVTGDRQWQQKKGRVIFSILRDFYLPAMVLAIPYYVVNWRHVWGYFSVNTMGNYSEIWNFKEGYGDVLKAFTIHGPSSSMISGYLFFFVGIVIFATLFFFYKRKWPDLSLLVGLLAVAVTSLGIIVYGRHNNPYFGLTYQMILCCAVCYCLSFLYNNKILFAVIVTAFIMFTGWHLVTKPLPKMVSNETPVARKGHSVNLQIIQAIESRLKGFDQNVDSGKVFFSFAGEINANSSGWLALQRSMPLQFSDLHAQNDLDAYKKTISESDFVVVADEDAVGVYRWLPSFLIQRPVLEFIQTQPAMEEILRSKTSKDAVNGYIRLFANRSRLQAKEMTVFLPYPTIGFLPPEGPYPQWQLPIVRWGLYPESRITLPDELTGKFVLKLTARGRQGTQLIVTLNGGEIYRHVFSGAPFDDIAVPSPLPSGKKVIVFIYDGISDGSDKLNRSILFQDIRLIPLLK